mgnify:CR=1 FL=1
MVRAWVFMGLQFMLFPLGLRIPFLQLLFIVLTIGVPFLGYIFAKKFRERHCGGSITFFTCVSIHYLYVYVRLSICSGSALHLLPLYRWRVRIRSIPLHLKSVKETAGPELTTSLNQFEEAIDLLSGLTPLEMTFQLISQNMFYGMLMAIPTALIVMRKKKNE